jgi:hypothetical protein
MLAESTGSRGHVSLVVLVFSLRLEEPRLDDCRVGSLANNLRSTRRRNGDVTGVNVDNDIVLVCGAWLPIANRLLVDSIEAFSADVVCEPVVLKRFLCG